MWDCILWSFPYPSHTIAFFGLLLWSVCGARKLRPRAPQNRSWPLSHDPIYIYKLFGIVRDVSGWETQWHPWNLWLGDHALLYLAPIPGDCTTSTSTSWIAKRWHAPGFLSDWSGLQKVAHDTHGNFQTDIAVICCHLLVILGKFLGRVENNGDILRHSEKIWETMGMGG